MERSPFKFLDAYDRDDADRFFGRKRETAQLYNAVFSANLTLLYGASGTGKTSLVQCGLGNKFYDTDWFPLFIRRNQDLNESITRTLTAALSPESPPPEDFAALALPEKVKQLYLDHFRPVYLIFDQFEELFTQGDEEEQQQFYQSIHDLLRAGLQAKVLIVVREEWLAHMSDFERVIPVLFNNRLRIEPIREAVLWRQVIPGMVRAAGVEIGEPKTTVPLIIEQIADPREGVDLTDLQVYLDRLYRRAAADEDNSAPVTFTPDLVRQVGEIRDVLSVFLDEQIGQLAGRLEEKFDLENARDLPLDILFTLVTNDQTKRALDAEAVLEQLPPRPGLDLAVVRYCLEELEHLRLLNALD